MPFSQSLVLRLVLAVGAGVLVDPGAALRVLRVTPSGEAGPTTAVTVTFDRPVAGSLDRTVDPRAVLRISPAAAGTLDWRDPVTLRFRPAVPLTANTSYTVTVADSFAAMDGARLPEPYAFTFRVRGPRVLAGSPVGPDGGSRLLPPDTRFDLVLDSPVDSAALSREVYLEFNRLCRRPGVVRLAVESERAIAADDRWDFREAGGWERDRAVDGLRRVARLAPRDPLPHGCAGELVVPSAFGQAGGSGVQRWGFATYGDFRMARARCGWGDAVCPTGPIVLTFSTPVRGADVRRHVALRPALPFDLGDTSDVRMQWALQADLAPRTAYAVVADRGLTDAFGQTFTGNPVATAATTGYAAAINYASGRAAVERKGAGTFALSFVNVDTLEVVTAPVPDSLEASFLARSEWSWNDLWPALRPGARRARLPVVGPRDRVRVYGVKLPAPVYRRPGTPTLLAVQVTSPRLDSLSRRQRPIALLQVTDLGVHARVGSEEGVVWVTGASDGRPARGRGRRAARCEGTHRGAGGHRLERPGTAHGLSSGRGRRGYHGRRRDAQLRLPGLRERGPRDRPRPPWHQRLRPRLEPVAVQRRAGVRQRAAAGRGGGVHRARDLSPRRATLRQGDRPHRSTGRAHAPSRRRLAALGVRGAGGRQWSAGRAPRQHGGAVRVRHRRPALSAAGKCAARRLSRRGPAAARRALDRGRGRELSRRRVSPARVPRGCHRGHRQPLRRRLGLRAGRGALPLRRADGAGRGALDPPAAESLAGRDRDPQLRRLLRRARPVGGTRT